MCGCLFGSLFNLGLVSICPSVAWPRSLPTDICHLPTDALDPHAVPITFLCLWKSLLDFHLIYKHISFCFWKAFFGISLEKPRTKASWREAERAIKLVHCVNQWINHGCDKSKLLVSQNVTYAVTEPFTLTTVHFGQTKSFWSQNFYSWWTKLEDITRSQTAIPIIIQNIMCSVWQGRDDRWTVQIVFVSCVSQRIIIGNLWGGIRHGWNANHMGHLALNTWMKADNRPRAKWQ